MITRKLYITSIFLLLLTASSSAQYIQVNDTYTAQQLVQDVLLNNQCAAVSNVSVSGGAYSNAQSYGYFNGNGSSFPFQDGIILSTGRAVMAVGPNNSLLDDGNGIDWNGDSDLEQALDIGNSTNATVLEFDFIPLASKIGFEYMLSSEEYHDNAPCRYSDGFAFLLRESGTTNPYENLAVIPGTDIPVKVTSVHPLIGGDSGCPAQNEEYFGAFNGTSHPTNFNGQTKVMTATANVIPGTQYHIKLVIADEGNYRYDSAIFLGGGSFNATTDLGPDRLFTTGNPLCDGETEVLDATTPNAIAYQWYNGNTAITGATNATYSASAPGEYRVEVTFTASCIAEGSIRLEYNVPLNFGTYTLLQCDDDNDGLTAYNLDQAAQLAIGNDNTLFAQGYYRTLADAQNSVAAITPVSPFYTTVPNQPVYIKLENHYGCSGIATVNLAASNNMVMNPPPYGLCDTDGKDDGFFTFDLTTLSSTITTGLPAGVLIDYYPTYIDALTYSNRITNPQAYANITAYTQSVYARISQGSDCYGIAEAELIVYSFGSALDDVQATICKGSTVTLDAGSGFTKYTWDTTPAQTTQEIEVDSAGTFTVMLTNAEGCTGSKTFYVSESGAATGANISINDFKGGNNSITIDALGAGTYEYSINGITYQEENIFVNLESGEYTIYIRDINGCGPIFRKKVFVLDYPKFFTPNGDNRNDTWRIPRLANRPGVYVVISDRFGKIITGFSGNAAGWDGTLNSNKLPATDYWFVITLENGETVKGHFALIR